MPPSICIPSGSTSLWSANSKSAGRSLSGWRMTPPCRAMAPLKADGVEMILTLGTGMGSALFTDGKLCPGLELGHHPWREKTYEDYLGRRGLDKYGKKQWNKRLAGGHRADRGHLQLGPSLPGRRQYQEDQLQAAEECLHRVERRGHSGRRGALARQLTMVSG